MEVSPMPVSNEPVHIPALNLKAQYQAIRDEIEPVLRQILETQMFVMGPEVSGLESEVAAYCSATAGVGCSSGSDALWLPLLALDIGPGHEVITTPYTFFATAGSIWRTGALPVFVDIEPDTFNIDPAQIEAAITERTRAIIPVHLFGQTADMGPIKELAQRHGLTILEDAAQSIGAAYQGVRAGTLGDLAAFSFYPSKNLGGFGDGGMITTNDPRLARRLARLRVHGMEPKYHHHEVGYNSRLDALQAAVLRVKLRHLDEWTALRRQAADRYRGLFAAHGLTELVGLPVERPGNFHVYNQFVIRVPSSLRDGLRDYLTARKIGTEIYYPIPLHLQVCFSPLGKKAGAFPNSEAAARETIALPIYPELSDAEQHYVVGSIRQFIAEHARPSRTTDKAA
jgi:dTDP-4-amino-4,6-dideoxygalactose transaminase